jgi:hypothetical protein
VSLDTDGKPIELTRVEESGEVKDGGVEVRPAKEGMRPRTLKVPSPFTSNWSLFEAVQRLPGKETSPIQFALLEDLDLLKEGQRLTFRGETTLTLNGKTIPLQEYQQIGDGILPFHYNLDEQRRLIVALSGQRAYLWNPKAQEQLAEIQDRVLRKVQNEQKKNG